MLNRPLSEVRATYAGQAHRRFIKTYTPLDGLPLRDDVTYVVVGRDPRDVSISMEHHMANMDMDRFLELRTRAVGSGDLAEVPKRTPPSGDPRERFRTFVEADDLGGPATLAGVLHHLSTGWERRSAPNVALFHYSDYQADLPGEMVRLAAALGIELAERRVVELAAEASLELMRERAPEVVPSASLGMWKDTTAFLRAGASGQWQLRVTEDDLVRYAERVASLVSPELAAWAHLGRLGSCVDPG